MTRNMGYLSVDQQLEARRLYQNGVSLHTLMAYFDLSERQARNVLGMSDLKGLPWEED